MAYKNGRLYKCDRCGAETFCACTGEGETDGGFTRWNTFEPLPEGWESYIDLRVGLLCPECNAEYTSVVQKFKETVKEENQ